MLCSNNREFYAQMKLYYFSFNAFGYFIPLVLSCALYAKMLHRFWLTGEYCEEIESYRIYLGKAAVNAAHNKLSNACTVNVGTPNATASFNKENSEPQKLSSCKPLAPFAALQVRMR